MGEQLVHDVGVEHLHAATVVGLLVEHADGETLELIGAHVDATEVRADGVEQVEVVERLILLADLQEQIAVDDEAVEELVLAVGAARARSVTRPLSSISSFMTSPIWRSAFL